MIDDQGFHDPRLSI